MNAPKFVCLCIACVGWDFMLYSYYYVAHCMIYLVLYDLSALVLLWHPLYNVIFWSWFVYHFSFPARNHTHPSLPHTQAFITHPHLPHTHIHTVLLISSLETPINELNCESWLDKCVLTDTPIGLKPATLNSSNSFSTTVWKVKNLTLSKMLTPT